MINFRDWKLLVLLAVILVPLLGFSVYTLISDDSDGTDDWQYSYQSIGYYGEIGGIVIIIASSVTVLLWVLIPTYLLVRGYRTENSELRKIGIGLLVVLVVFVGSSLFAWLFLLLVFLLIAAGIGYALKKRMKLALIPLASFLIPWFVMVDEYNATTSLIILVVSFLLLWLSVPVYLIVKGRAYNGNTVARKLGIFLIAGPVAFFSSMIGLTVILDKYTDYNPYSGNFDLLSVIFYLIALALIIAGILYALKKGAKIALVPLILPAVFLILSIAEAYWNPPFGAFLLITLILMPFLWLPFSIYLVFKNRGQAGDSEVRKFAICLIIVPLSIIFTYLYYLYLFLKLFLFKPYLYLFHYASFRSYSSDTLGNIYSVYIDFFRFFAYQSGDNFGNSLVFIISTILGLILVVVPGIAYILKKRVKLALIPLMSFLVLLVTTVIFLSVIITLLSAEYNSVVESYISSDQFISKEYDGYKDDFYYAFLDGQLPLGIGRTYERMHSDSFFEAEEKKSCAKPFCPYYAYALSKDPISQKEEHYLQVGINSDIEESDFERKKLNLVVVLDVSNQMRRSNFAYEENSSDLSNLELTLTHFPALLDQLNHDDGFGMVMFNSDGAYLGKPLGSVGNADVDALKNHVSELSSRGGFGSPKEGYRLATKLFEEFPNTDNEAYENRILVIAHASTLFTEKTGEFLDLISKNSNKRIYTNFILIDTLSYDSYAFQLYENVRNIKGVNYLKVHYENELRELMDDEFKYIVTPLGYNFVLRFESSDFEIEKIYGSSEGNEITGEIMNVKTLFPSKSPGPKKKQGMVLLKLRKTGSQNQLNLITTYEDASGNRHGDEMLVNLPSVTSNHYENAGIRHGVALARHFNFIANFVKDERKSHDEKSPVSLSITRETGITIPSEAELLKREGEENESIPFMVSDEYLELIRELKDYLEKEKEAIGTDSLGYEIYVLEEIMSFATSEP